MGASPRYIEPEKIRAQKSDRLSCHFGHAHLCYNPRTRPEFPFWSGTGSGEIWAGTGSGPVPVDLAGTRPVPQFFSCCIIGFMMSYQHHVPLQFPDCIMCYPSVPRLHHVLSSSSLAVSRATLKFTKCIILPPPFGDTWRGKLSLFLPFVTFIDFTLITDISA